jgi:hypothetical protein
MELDTQPTTQTQSQILKLKISPKIISCSSTSSIDVAVVLRDLSQKPSSTGKLVVQVIIEFI